MIVASENRPPRTGGQSAGIALLPALLRSVATAQSPDPGLAPLVIQWERVTDRQVQDVLDAGLGPLLFHATRELQGAVPDIWRDVLHAEDLTARVRHGNLCDAMLEILDACNAAGVPVTLLKGISIADQCYPLAHLRPMGDIDILVSEEHCIWIEEALLHRGYEPKAGYVADAGEPHRAPLLDPKRGVWVEVHTALFPAGDRLLSDSLFSALADCARGSGVDLSWAARAPAQSGTAACLHSIVLDPGPFAKPVSPELRGSVDRRNRPSQCVRSAPRRGPHC